MYQYLDLARNILHGGCVKGDRTGTGTRSLFGEQLRFDLNRGFPMITTKRVNFRAIVGELLWFLSGSTNVKPLNFEGIKIWDAWATEDGSLGPVYGHQFRKWNGCHDQISELMTNLRQRPDSRRHIVSAWNVSDLPDEALTPQQNVLMGKMALAPCHCMFQFYVADGYLSCQLMQRSCDFFIGAPYNIASYALLTHMVAQQLGLQVHELIVTYGDVHIYENHISQITEQLSRDPMPLPKLNLSCAPSIFDYTLERFALENYEAWPAISAPVAV